MIARSLLILAMLLVWLIVLLPLKAVTVAAGGAGQLGYEDVFGTVWNGRVYGLTVQGERVREIAVSVAPLPLLAGRISADWRAADDGFTGNGHAVWAPGHVRLDNASLTLPMGRLANMRDGLDPRDPVFVRLARLELRDGRCVEAAGSVRSGALVEPAAAYGVDAPPLEGDIACADGDVVMTFSGETPDVTVNGRVLLRAGGYDWQVDVRTGSSELADALALAGFQAEGDRWHAEGYSAYGSND